MYSRVAGVTREVIATKTAEMGVARVRENRSFSGTGKNTFCEHLFRLDEGIRYFLSYWDHHLVEEFDQISQFEIFVQILRLC